MNILILGASYTGRYIAVNFSNENKFYFLSRRQGHFSELSYYVDPNIHIDCIINTIPPLSSPSSRKREPPYHPQVSSLLEKNPSIVYLYISSTAVFPSDSKGEIKSYVESDYPRPDTTRGKRRLEEEEMILSFYPKARIIRSAGIYGPGRSVVSQLLSGNFSRIFIGNRIISRIHVCDLARILLTVSRGRGTPHPLIHAVDELPAPYKEVFLWLEGYLVGFQNGLQNSLQNGLNEGLLPQGLLSKGRLEGNWRDEPVKGRMIRSLYVKDLLGKYSFPTFREGFFDILSKKDGHKGSVT